MLLTLDSSVIIAALRADEEKHKECKELMANVKDGKYVALEPYTILVEVVAAIKRRTNSKTLAEKVGEDLQNLDNIYFFELVKSRAESASAIAAEIGAKGMDAVVIQIAKENKSILVTLDREMVEKAKSVVKVMSAAEL